jgi:hypothetical protein
MEQSGLWRDELGLFYHHQVIFCCSALFRRMRPFTCNRVEPIQIQMEVKLAKNQYHHLD